MGAWALAQRSGRKSSRVPSKPPAIEPAQVTTATPSRPRPRRHRTERRGGEPPKTAREAAVQRAAGGARATPATCVHGVQACRNRVSPGRTERQVPLVETDGVFALLAGRRALAYVDPAGSTSDRRPLHADDAYGGTASQIEPRWSPDSSAVLGLQDTTGGHGPSSFRCQPVHRRATFRIGRVAGRIRRTDGRRDRPPTRHFRSRCARDVQGRKALRISRRRVRSWTSRREAGASTWRRRAERRTRGRASGFVPFCGAPRILSGAQRDREAGGLRHARALG